MKHQVIHKQHNSKNCIVCGLSNELGLKASFYELENKELVAIFTPIDEHQSYPGRMHGGISSAILDETIGRAIMIHDPGTWGVTIALSLKYLKPVPLGEEVRVVGRILKDSRRIFEGTGEILLKNGDVAVTAEGRYLKMPIERIADFDHEQEHWQVVPLASDPSEIDL